MTFWWVSKLADAASCMMDRDRERYNEEKRQRKGPKAINGPGRRSQGIRQGVDLTLPAARADPTSSSWPARQHAATASHVSVCCGPGRVVVVHMHVPCRCSARDCSNCLRIYMNFSKCMHHLISVVYSCALALPCLSSLV